MAQPNEWLAAGLRVTAFPSEPQKIDGLSWWLELLGYPPEAQTIRPKAGQRQEEGEYEGRKLTLRIQPERIDWILAPVVKAPSEVLEGMLVVGPFGEVVASLVNLIERWLPVSPPITRLAVGGVFAQPVDDVRAGYLRLARYLPTIHLDPDSSDFFYQINRPRPSRVVGLDGLRINRLSKWSVVVLQQISLAVSGKAVTATTPETVELACRLEVDVNTDPHYRAPLPQANLPVIFRELVETAEEIALRGDIP